MTTRHLCLIALSLTTILALAGGIAGSAPPQTPPKSMPDSVYTLDKGRTLVLSASPILKPAAGMLKSLLPTDPAEMQPVLRYDPMNLTLELRGPDGDSALIGQRLMQVLYAVPGGVTVRIVKAALDHAELVVLFSIQPEGGPPSRIGVWRIALIGPAPRGARPNVPRALEVANDEVTFLGIWAMDSQGLPEVSRKTVGAQLTRDNTGRWSIELTEPMQHPSMSAALYEQDPAQWKFILKRGLGGANVPEFLR